MKISNVHIYGMDNSIRVSGFPMALDTNHVNTREQTVDRLASAAGGSGHDNFLKGIIVQFDLRCTNKMWVEAERYHWFDIVSSQSTMHRISQLSIDGQCNEYVDERIIAVTEELKDKYLETKDPEDYLRLLYNVPSGFELTAGITTNYQQLKTIYHQRKHHRLKEWRAFCEWIESLPMMDKWLQRGE